jgi:hypothetical protein
MDFCDAARADQINKALTQFIVGCALPFAIIQTVFFIKFIASLNAAYAAKWLPKVKVFRTRFVPELFEDTKKNVNSMWDMLGSPLLTIGWDALKTEAGPHVVNVTETAGNKTAFKSCVDPKLERETGVCAGS